MISADRAAGHVDGKVVGIIKNIRTQRRRSGGFAVHRGQAAATTEDTFADGRNRVGDSHRGQAAAIMEGIVADGSDRVWYGHRGQAAAIKEDPVADGSDRVGDGH